MQAAGAVSAEHSTGAREWGEAAGICVVLAVAAVAVQAATPYGEVRLPPSPGNWLVVFGPLFALAVQQRCYPENRILRCLGGVPMAVCALLFLALASLPGGIWPQGEQAPAWQQGLGIDNVFRSLPFAVATSLVLVNLTLVCAKRVWPLSVPNIRFLLIHFGLLLAIAAAVAGTGSLKRAHLVLPLEERSRFANVAENGEWRIRLPFGVRVLDFHSERFPPTAALVRRDAEGDIEIERGSRLLKEGAKEQLGDYVVRVGAYVEKVAIDDNVLSPSEALEAGPAVYVKVQNAKEERLVHGWLHAPTPVGEELRLPLDERTLLVMEPPESLRYASRIEVDPSTGAPYESTVEVNQPLRVEGWWLYQTSYGRMDDGTAYVVLEAIRDRALPVVYLGFALLLAGVVWFAWGTAANNNGPGRPGAERTGS